MSQAMANVTNNVLPSLADDAFSKFVDDVIHIRLLTDDVIPILADIVIHILTYDVIPNPSLIHI
jgi:hypothetical protein